MSKGGRESYSPSRAKGVAMERRLQTYEAPGIVVTFDPGVCIHSGACVRGLPLVFDIRRKRWVRPELASPAAVAAQVARCPSGALQCRRTDTAEAREDR
jgi:uncharacterized Fe-S cluster protein YjdI